MLSKTDINYPAKMFLILACCIDCAQNGQTIYLRRDIEPFRYNRYDSSDETFIANGGIEIEYTFSTTPNHDRMLNIANEKWAWTNN